MRVEPWGISACAPDEIRKSMFLPLMKNTLIWGIWGIRQNYSFFSYNKILYTPLPLMSATVENISNLPPYRWNLPASVYLYIWERARLLIYK